METQTRSGNVRRWLRRPDCPAAIRQLKCFFDKAFTPVNSSPGSNQHAPKTPQSSYVHLDDAIFSPESTHAGNTTVIYQIGTDTHAGMIVRIENVNSGLRRLHIRRHLPLPPNEHDPFASYVDFPATTYSTSTKHELDVVSLHDIISHAARFDYSLNRSVFLNLARA